MENQNPEQAQNIELTSEELEEIQGAGPLVSPGNFPIGIPNPDTHQWFVPTGFRLRIPDYFPHGIVNPDVLQQIQGLR